MEGSIRKSGNHLRVRAQLVRADTGYTSGRRLSTATEGCFKIQDEIATQSAAACRSPLSGGPLDSRAGRHPEPRGLPTALCKHRAYVNENTRVTESIPRLAARASVAARSERLDLRGTVVGFIWRITQPRLVMFHPAIGFERARHFAHRAITAQSGDLPSLTKCSRTCIEATTGTGRRPALNCNGSGTRSGQSGGADDGRAIGTDIGQRDEAERLLRAALMRDPLSSQGLI